MKALLLGIMFLLFPFPLAAQEPEHNDETLLKLMPPAATGISHGYALWSTGQLANPYGCIAGEASVEAIEVWGAGPVADATACAQRKQAIGYLSFSDAPLPQDDVCLIARTMRNRLPELVVFGLVYGLQIKQIDGRDYTSPRVVWCSTPVLDDGDESQLDTEAPGRPPARRT